MQESPEKSPSIVIPEDFESQKEMVRMVMNVLHKKTTLRICRFPLLFLHILKASIKFEVDAFMLCLVPYQFK